MRKKRKESFFGIHFDFHAMEGETVGAIYRPDVVAKLLDKVKPDFVQCDTKGHAGFSSYPTNIGTRAFEIKEDVLKMWRTLTAEREIALYGHHSGLYDMQVAEKHPDWAIIDESGTVSDSYLSPFSPYADEILLPQLRELAVDYKLDGAWIDGECWGAYMDYSTWAKDKYTAQTGKQPAVRGDSDYEEYREFCRQGFLQYVRHYVTEIKKIVPEFQITSNWIFSAYMPMQPCVDVDFLSGDYSPNNSMQSARINSRCIASKGMTWDLLAWGQSAVPCSWETRNRTTKEPVQYCHEASEIIAMGGAFAFFNIMYGGGGYVQEWAIPTWEKVASFVRERQETCFGSEEVPEIAVLYAEDRPDLSDNSLFSSCTEGAMAVQSWVDALQNIQISCNILHEYQIASNASKYSVIVIPDTKYLCDKSISDLKKYVENGGKLLIDSASAGYFTDITGIDPTLFPERLLFADGGTGLASLETKCLQLDGAGRANSVYYEDNFYDDRVHAASVLTKYGKGSIVTIGLEYAKNYQNNISPALEDYLKKILASIEFKAIVKTNNRFVDVITRKKDGKLLVNLINYSGSHAVEAVRTYREIPPLCDVAVSIAFDHTPKSVMLEPQHEKAEFDYSDGKITLQLPRLEIHTVIVAE